ncbi:hypothetical protein EMIHUDRAFT_234554 [Emiliania huxleyi CCMP1516]|uniref:Uncharacterized protein n=2 Tax=Emiliania huxleyi TaxID=2903 RepID=A0A0D3JZC6_EMIH1|nr:hypothetical protein EMIHUDRAFT_234554 [Emiliania huxleyi CCMP1516]EOD28861.1 hypothetical protein EMIHUDRAFT_234554 [Emiliania huxleyi CCMP1516]|eukprot:XP_005781290.1 hypothetical protein EMIHUDRAFT_234554 [Emiliania huxleyi CCMP1516]
MMSGRLSFAVLCQLAKLHYPAVLARTLAEVVPRGAMANPASDEARLKDAVAMRQRLVSAAEATLQHSLRGGREASAKQLCKTRLALERGTLEVSRLDSGEYGKETETIATRPISSRPEASTQMPTSLVVAAYERRCVRSTLERERRAAPARSGHQWAGIQARATAEKAQIDRRAA